MSKSFPIEYQGVQNSYKLSDFYLVQLKKFEVLHGQSQLSDLSQSGSSKGSANKVTRAHDIPVLIHIICFFYMLMMWSTGFLGSMTHYYMSRACVCLDTVSITSCLAIQNVESIRYFKSQFINNKNSTLNYFR